MIYEKCKDILLRESELIQIAAEMQENLRLAVIEREWDSIEDRFKAINEVEEKMAVLESEREELFADFELTQNHDDIADMDAKSRFILITKHLPENQQNDLLIIYSNLKMEAMKLRMANETLVTYLAGIKSIVKEFFELAFPDRAGKMYTSRGTHHSNDMRSMMLNQSF
jgi:hypothetical protein